MPRPYLIPNISLDRTMPVPLPRQMEEQIRAAIRRGDLPAGTRLPSSRTLAKLLGTARSTVVAAYEGLMDAGLLHARRGSGIRVRGKEQPAARGLANLRGALRAAHYPLQIQPFTDPDGTALYFNASQT